MPNPRLSFLGIEVLSQLPPPQTEVDYLVAQVISTPPEPAPPQFDYLVAQVVSVPPVSSPNDLGPTPSASTFFLNNWADEFEIENGYSTDVQRSTASGAQERKVLLEKPVRELSGRWDIDRSRGMRDLPWWLMRLASQRVLAPIYCDVTPLTAFQDPASKYVACDTTTRRFSKGSKAVVFEYISGVVSRAAFVTISSISDTGFFFEEANPWFDDPEPDDGALAWQSAFAVPVMLAETELRSSSQLETDELVRLNADFTEVVGPQTLRVEEALPGSWPTYDGLPIFNPKNNWVTSPTLGVRREGQQASSGRGVVIEARGPRAAWVQSYSMLFEDRASAWEMLTFLHSRKGRGLPFWCMGHAPLWEASGSTSSAIQVVPTQNYENLEFLDFVGIEMLDGTVIIREVTSTVDNDTNWAISVTPDLPGGFDHTQIRKLTWAGRAANARDSFTEVWSTTEICQIELLIEEALGERRVVTPSLEQPSIFVAKEGRLILSVVPPEVSTL